MPTTPSSRSSALVGFAWAVRGHVEAFLHRSASDAIPWLDRAVELKPSSAVVWSLSAADRCYIGDSATALQHANRASRLNASVVSPFSCLVTTIRAIASAVAGEYEASARIAREALLQTPNFVAAYPPL